MLIAPIFIQIRNVFKLINSDGELISLCKNRVQEIKKDSGIVFGYVSSKDQHPANVATRGTDVKY